MLRTLAINSNQIVLSFGVLIAFLITKAIRDWGELCGIFGKPIWSSETWRTKALKSFAISKSGMQGGEAKRNLPWSNFLCQSCQPLLEHFLKSNLCMLYVVSKLRNSKILCFKRCAIRSWNEGVIAIASWSLQAEGRFLHICEISLLLREFRSHFAQCTGVLLKLPDSCDQHCEIFFFRFFDI